MSIKEKIAKIIAPNLRTETEIKSLVAEEVKKARMAMPMNLDYDPKGEGYRRLSGGEDERLRDLSPMTQDRMFEIAYYMYDTSGLVKRFAGDTKNFILGEGITYEVANDEKGEAKKVLDTFWNHSINQLDIRLKKRIEFLGILGEQCWPVSVNKLNGQVFLSYIDPGNIDDVYLFRGYPEVVQFVKLKGSTGVNGRTLVAIREELDPRKKEFGRLTGDCFFFAINNPPNSPRGRSDFIQTFDAINGFEEGLFDELDRQKLIKSFIWDVQVKGATEEDLQKFLRNNKTPKSGSVRAHNESVEWDAVAPDLKISDSKAFFELMRTYLSACQNRPDSWFGSGGKAYQTEADLMGEPTFKDLGERQLFVKYIIGHVLKFVLDQAILYGGLKETKDKPFAITVNMPEMQTKDLSKIITGLFTLAQALILAQSSGWIRQETATQIFATVAQRVGIEIDAAEEIEKAAKKLPEDGSQDYVAREAMINEIIAKIKARNK